MQIITKICLNRIKNKGVMAGYGNDWGLFPKSGMKISRFYTKLLISKNVFKDLTMQVETGLELWEMLLLEDTQ